MQFLKPRSNFDGRFWIHQFFPCFEYPKASYYGIGYLDAI